MSIRIFDTPELLYAAAAASVARMAGDAVAARGRFLLVLSGGETALPLFHRLAQSPCREELPWENTHVFWADERLVPPDDEASNFGQARSVMLCHLPIPAEQIHAIPGELGPEAAVHNYAKELAALAAPGLAWPRFDLVLLGLGADGHTASLFPGSASQLAEHVPALAVQAQYQDRPASRVTLTPAAINSAREVIFVVTGAKKADALAQALTPGASSEKAPARLIRPVNGSLTWFVDRDAASRLDAGSAGAPIQQRSTSEGERHD